MIKVQVTATLNLGAIIHQEYNKWRAEQGLDPVQLHTLRRYLAGGQGYENGLPKKFAEFLRTAFGE
jgi:hypothetical protein